MNTTLQLTQQNSYSFHDAIQASNHLKSLRRLRDNGESALGMPEQKIKRLQTQGFMFFVTDKFVSLFKYAAAVTHSYYLVMNGLSSNAQDLIYCGDMPDFALALSQEAKQSGIKYLTIHSNDPLPVHRIIPDPVLLGWYQSPDIVCNENGCYCQKEVFAVVIAIWLGESGRL